MTRLDIPRTSSTPQIFFHEVTGILAFSGESFPENSFEFYAPVFAWLRDYLAEHDELKLDINISYMNSSSTKCLLDILDILEENHGKGARIALVWRYYEGDLRSQGLAMEFQEEVTFPFDIAACEE